jgi:DNA helicase-2/ATP-dependent DNA helicase PcrA
MLKKESKTPEEKGEAQIENVNQLVTAAREYDSENPEGTLGRILANVSLVSDADHLKDSGGAVTLMTLHARQGLEFPAVAIIGLEEGVPAARPGARASPASLKKSDGLPSSASPAARSI